MDEEKEFLGEAIDRVDSLARGLHLPLPANTHYQMLKNILPEVVADLKQGFVAVTGENPWEN